MARRICPQCGSRETAKILYGMPTWSPELDEQINKGGIVLGGCCITRCDPVYRCNKCKKDFGAPTADLEADTTSFYFSLGGYFDGYQSVTVTKIDNGAVMIYTPGHAPESETIEKQLRTAEWLSFIHSLYRCYMTHTRFDGQNPLVYNKKVEGVENNAKTIFRGIQGRSH